jgi:hypothetical protein
VFAAMDGRLTISSDPVNPKYLTIYYRPAGGATPDARVAPPSKVLVNPDLAELVSRLGGEGSSGLNFNYGDVVSILSALTDDKKLVAYAGGQRVPAQFVLQEMQTVESQILDAPAIPTHDRRRTIRGKSDGEVMGRAEGRGQKAESEMLGSCLILPSAFVPLPCIYRSWRTVGMRLKKLILQGFKSFADRTEFLFDSPITGIVGPNGCGKSNVVDGFKWVLGEQSAKSLRGDAMMDVIFNGSGGRKPAGMAEVTLVFETRRARTAPRSSPSTTTRSQSAGRLYLRRDQRIPDQQPLLAPARTSASCSSTPASASTRTASSSRARRRAARSQPRRARLIFEEAAGHLEVQAAKKEAIRKLEKVDQNLLRVNDIVEEVEKSALRSVKIRRGGRGRSRDNTRRLSSSAPDATRFQE